MLVTIYGLGKCMWEKLKINYSAHAMMWVIDVLLIVLYQALHFMGFEKRKNTDRCQGNMFVVCLHKELHSHTQKLNLLLHLLDLNWRMWQFYHIWKKKMMHQVERFSTQSPTYLLFSELSTVSELMESLTCDFDDLAVIMWPKYVISEEKEAIGD